MNVKYLLGEVFNDGWSCGVDWDALYGSETEYFSAWHKHIAKMMPDCKSVCDIGCSVGTALAYYRDTLKPDVLLGVDASAVGCERTRQKGIDSICTDAEEFLNNEIRQGRTWQYIVMSQVLEHLLNPSVILYKATQVAEHVIIGIPNTGYILCRARLFFGRFHCQWGGDHLRYWTIKDMLWWLRNEGYVIEDAAYLLNNKWDWLVRLWPNLFALVVIVKIRRK
jgi:methionine biosynthesis protein MetW